MPKACLVQSKMGILPIIVSHVQFLVWVQEAKKAAHGVRWKPGCACLKGNTQGGLSPLLQQADGCLLALKGGQRRAFFP